MEAINTTFGKERVKVDGNSYTGCTFDEATIEYSGGELPLLERCSFNNCVWDFTDAAGRTLQLLQALNRAPGGSDIIDATFPFTFRAS